MPWDVTIHHPNDEALGPRDEVIKLVSAAVPAITWFEEPPLLERIKDMPDHPFHELIPTWPEETRASFARSTTLGDFESDDFSIRLYGFETVPVKAIHLEIRGNGNPLPFIAAICLPSGWIAVDCSNGQTLDFSSRSASGWERFREYRDRVIREHVR